MSQKSRPKTSATWRSLMALSSMAFLYVGPAVSAPTHASGSALLAATESNTATNSVHLKAGAEIHSVLVHPLFEKTYACVEHGADSLQWYLGDALGADCFIVDMIDLNGRSWYRAYKKDGEQNED